MTNRRVTDHVHPEYWTSGSQHRFEDRVTKSLESLREDVDAIGARITLILGGIALLAFLAPLLAPFLTAWVGIDTPAGQ